jgi:DNA-binding beta-propeller fold protein YncE
LQPALALPAPAGVKDHSLATPVGMAVTPDGTTLYVAAFGSSKIGVFDTTALQNDTFDPTVTSASYLTVTLPTTTVAEPAPDDLR